MAQPEIPPGVGAKTKIGGHLSLLAAKVDSVGVAAEETACLLAEHEGWWHLAWSR